MTTSDKLSEEFLNKQNREWLESISTPLSRQTGGIHSAHANRWGLHATSSNYDCDLCQKEREAQKDQEEKSNGF